MAQYLINVQAKNRLEQKGLLKRFNINCYGDEKTIVEMRSQKAEKYEQLKNNKDIKEYNKYFYKYVPNKTQKKDTEKIPLSFSKQYNTPQKYNRNKNTYRNKNKYRRTRNNKKRTKKNIVGKVFDKFF